MKNIHLQLLELLRSGERIVLATVVRTTGSTPQKPGSSALFGEKGLIAGTVGGGILEGEVQEIAQHVLISEVSDQYYFDLDSGQGKEGAICGGAAEVLVDANPQLHRQSLEAMEMALSRRKEGNMLTLVSNQPGTGRSIKRYWIPSDRKPALPRDLDPELRRSVSAHLASGTAPGFSEIVHGTRPDSGTWSAFMEPIRPLPRLVIAGAGHVGKALAHLASLLEFEITIIDDRQEYACMENIPEADHFIVADIGSAMRDQKPGPDTYVVIVTRGHHQDGEALRPCIGSGAAYIGMIGSANKVTFLKKKFLEEGWVTPDQWAKIHTPIGIPIGSRTVQEIAVSIAAELVSVRSKILSGNAI
jgi:xanthine dehydrogenase accessory factor